MPQVGTWKKPPAARARRKTAAAALALQDSAPAPAPAPEAEVKKEPSKIPVKAEAGQSSGADKSANKGDRSSVGKTNNRQRAMAVLDEDMRLVAEKHFALNPHTQTKSLEGLVPSAYLDMNADTKALNNILNGVESSVCDSVWISDQCDEDDDEN